MWAGSCGEGTQKGRLELSRKTAGAASVAVERTNRYQKYSGGKSAELNVEREESGRTPRFLV